MVIEGVEQLVLQLLRRERHLWSRTTGTRKPRDLDRRQRSLRPSRPPTPPSLTGDRRPPTTDNDGDDDQRARNRGIDGHRNQLSIERIMASEKVKPFSTNCQV